MAYDFKRHRGIVHPTKTGGSTVSKSFGLWRKGPYVKPVKDQDALHHTAEELFQLIGAKEWEAGRILSWVRCPYARLQSAFHFLGREAVQGFQCRRDCGEAYQRTTFETFVTNRLWLEYPWNARPAFWMPQTDYLNHDGVEIFRTELLHKNWDELCEVFGMQKPYVVLNANPNREHYSASYTDEMKLVVGEYYGGDLERFGYEYEDRTEDPWKDFGGFYCINLRQHDQRWAKMRSFFESVGLGDRVERFEAITPRGLGRNGGHVGCVQSHRAIIQKAYDAGLQTVVVFEDDCFLKGKWSELVRAVKELHAQPEGWDTYNFGSYWYEGRFKRSKYKRMTPTMYSANYAGGTHAIVYSRKGMAKVLQLVPDNDRAIARLLKQTNLACDTLFTRHGANLHPYPALICQSGGESSTEHRARPDWSRNWKVAGEWF